MKKTTILLAILMVLIKIQVNGQNPVIPGYYADPEIREFNGKYYLYATTDGHGRNGIGNYPLVWISDDLIQWKPQKLEGIKINYFWAPAVIQGDNGKYYLYNTNGIDFKTAMVWESQKPEGPWTYRNAIDGFDIEPFKDPKTGKYYLTTNGLKLLELDNNIKSKDYLTKVVKEHKLNGTFPDFTEGAYLFYKDGFYYMMWSGGRCWEDNYNVHYSVSDDLFGTYEYGKNNPIIKTDSKAGIYGPGHHSILEYKSSVYLVYHRQDRTHQEWCDYRFTCFAELNFDGKYINTAKPIDIKKELGDKRVNLAFGKFAFSSGETVGHEVYKINDNDFATRWEGTGSGATITIDLEKVETFQGMDINMEYPDRFTAFKVETSDNYVDWAIYDDQSILKEAWSVSQIRKKGQGRFIRITFGNVEGRIPSIWEWNIWK